MLRMALAAAGEGMAVGGCAEASGDEMHMDGDALHAARCLNVSFQVSRQCCALSP